MVGGGQGVVLCPRTLSQARRTKLRRALTEATSETVNYVKMVGIINNYKKKIIFFYFNFIYTFFIFFFFI